MNRHGRRTLARWVCLLVVVGFAIVACGRTPFEDEFAQPGEDGGAGVSGTGAVGVGGTGAAGTGGTAGTGAVATGGSGGTGAVGTGGSGTGGSGGNPGCGPCQGCCDSTGVCRPGTDLNACGLGGVECFNCGALGFACIGGACEGKPPPCGPGTCNGCCDAKGQCQFGDKADACGLGGVKCDSCVSKGQSCIGGKCQGPPPTCGPKTCGGCCNAQGKCVPGTSAGSCGAGGTKCENCTTGGKICNQPGSYCAFLPSCGSVTCPTGCCDASGTCQDGRKNNACGSTGAKCTNCTASGQSCAPQGFCYSGTHCGPDNCAGCCTATGQCISGASSFQCGQFGQLCDNCLAKGQSCVAQTCSSGSTCPAAYPGCSPTANTTPPVAAKACASADISLLATACSGSASGCNSAFQQIFQKNPSCYDCMLQFVGDDAYTRCLAPYLSPNCNHDLTCAVRCGNTACGDCSPSAQDSCQTQVFGQGGECQSWVNGYFCAEAALSGPAVFCDFNGDSGSWIKSVGSHYCGNF